MWLDMVLERFRPSLWVFGHHHVTRKETINGCVFQAVGILDSVEYDVPSELNGELAKVKLTPKRVPTAVV